MRVLLTGCFLLLVLSPARAADAPPAAAGARDAEGDPLPAGAVARLGNPRFNHTGGHLQGLAFTPDGKLLATGGSDGSVRLWDMTTGLQVRRLTGHASMVSALAVSADGKTVLSVSSTGRYQGWQISTGNPAGAANEEGSHDTTGPGTLLYLSRDGSKAITNIYASRVQEWDVASGNDTRQWATEKGRRTPATVSADGKLLAWAHTDGGVHLIDLDSGKELRVLPGKATSARSLAFSPDGKTLATGSSADKGVTLWQVETGKQTARFDEPADFTELLAYSPDGQLLAGTSAGQVRLYTVTPDAGKPLHAFAVGARLHSLAFSKDSRLLAAGDAYGKARVFDVAARQEVLPRVGHLQLVHSVGFTDAGKGVITSDGKGVLRLWDTATGKLRHNFANDQLFMVPQGKLWTNTAEKNTLLYTGYDGSLSYWDLAAAKLTQRVQGVLRPYPFRLFYFSADGKVCALSDDGRTLVLWNVPEKKEERRLILPQAFYASQMLLAPDGRTLAVLGSDGLRFFDTASGEPVPHLNEVRCSGTGMCFAPNGRVLAHSNPDIHLCETATGAARLRIAHDPKFTATAMAISPDGRLLAATGPDNGIHLYETATGKALGRFAGHGAYISMLSFSPDSTLLASAGYDGIALLWGLGEARKGLTAPAGPPKAEELAGWWQDLMDKSPAKVHQAVWGLARCPGAAEKLLREQFQAQGAKVDIAKINKWVKELDDDNFEVRETASRELAAVGNQAEVVLREALKKASSPELKLRIQTLLDKAGSTAKDIPRLRLQRALEVLELLGTAEAQAIVEQLAKGSPELWETQQARLSLEFLQRLRGRQ